MGSSSNLEAARLAFLRRLAMQMAHLLPAHEWETKEFLIEKSYAVAYDYFDLGKMPEDDPGNRLESEVGLIETATHIAEHYPPNRKDGEFVRQELYRCARYLHRQQAQTEVRQATNLLRFRQTY